MSLKELAESAVEEGVHRLLIIDRWKGGPGRIRLYRIKDGNMVQVPPQISIQGIKLQREFGMGERALNSLIIGRPLHESSETRMLAHALSDFFNIPVMDIDEAGSRCEAVMQIQLDANELISLSFFLLPKMIEIGPRVTISHLVWNLS
ncbi:MAG: hypothetical protein ACE5NN_01765 [Candidatus Bathyarchaeia archaeon]